MTGSIHICTGPLLTNTTIGLGFGWERPASIENFNAGDSESLKADCVLEVQGGNGRRPEKSPKHSYRITLRSFIGLQKLDYPHFGGDAGSSFNSSIHRAGFGNTVIHLKLGLTA